MPVVPAKQPVIGNADAGLTPRDHLVMAVVREKYRLEERGELVSKPTPKVIGSRKSKSGGRLRELGFYRVLTLAEADSKWEGRLPAWCPRCRDYRRVRVGTVREALTQPSPERVIAV
jgi:hypothetical protein